MIDTLIQIFADKAASRNNFLTAEKITAIHDLWNKHKKEQVEAGDTIICLDMGKFGNIEIRHVTELDKPTTLKYKEGYYDFVSIRSDYDRTILFTDYSTTQPYNRQSPFYVGYSFESMQLIKDSGEWRRYETVGKNNICFSVWGFSYNKYCDLIQFGICMKTESVNEFLETILKILEK